MSSDVRYDTLKYTCDNYFRVRHHVEISRIHKYDVPDEENARRGHRTITQWNTPYRVQLAK